MRRRSVLSSALACLLAIHVLSAPFVLADSCSMQPVCDPEYNCHYEWICEPEYYVWQSTEPDWCLYSFGDEIDFDYDIIGGTLVLVGWYVTPESDPGRDGDAMVTNCTYVNYPW